MLTANSTIERDAPGDGVHHVSPQPPRPGDAGGQHGLQGPAGLVDPHPQQHLDDVDGDEHAGHLDDRDPVGVDDPVGAARLGPPVARRCPRASWICSVRLPKISPNIVRATAHPRNAPRCSRQTSPAGLSRVRRGLARGRAARATVRGRRPCARRARPRWPAARRGRRRRAAAATSGRRRTAGSAVPTRSGTATTGQALVTREAGPVDGAEHVADAAERERDAEDAGGDAGGAARGGGQLAGHRRDADPHQPDRGHRGAGQQRALDRLPVDGDRQPRAPRRGRRRRPRRRGRPRPGRRTGRRRWSRASRRGRAPRSGGCAGSPRRCSSARRAPPA